MFVFNLGQSHTLFVNIGNMFVNEKERYIINEKLKRNKRNEIS